MPLNPTPKEQDMSQQYQPNPLQVEAIREAIMEIPYAQKYVNDYADMALEHFQSNVDMITDQDILDELRCQYQWQAWNKLFWAIGQHT